jgi:translation initiation factor IF-2
MTTGAKMRVYEIARDVGIPNKDLIVKIRGLGLEVNNHMSSLEPEDVARVKRAIDKERLANTVTKRLSSSVLRRRSKKDKAAAGVGATADGTGVEVRSRERAKPPTAVTVTVTAAPVPTVRTSERVQAPTVKPAVPAQSGAEAAARHNHKVAVEKVTPAVAARPAETPAPAAPKEPEKAAATAPAAEIKSVSPPAQAKSTVQAKPAAKPETPPPAVSAPQVSAPTAATPPRPEPTNVTPPQAAPSKRVPEVAVKPAAPAPARAPAGAPPAPAARAPVADEARPSAPAPAADGSDRRAAARRPPAAQVSAADKPAELAPRTQFERELQRAREQVRMREREAERVVKQPQPTGGQVSRPAGRPEVGSVISLPMTRIKITERAPARPGAARTRFQPPQRRPGGRRNETRFGKKRMAPGKKGKATQITTPAEHKRVIKIEDTISVQDLARHMAIKSTELLRKLWGLGMVGININAAIDFETANIIASEFGYEVQNVAFQEDIALTSATDTDEDLQPRPAVVTVMGHVDHGKTTLLDAIRQTRVAAGEAGGITQHIAAYRVPVPAMGDLVFLDTPGHAAFTAMRARGAQATDIVVLVIAADDGVMPQTVEALNHAKDAKVPIIVAVNKIDAPSAQPDRIRQQLAEHELIPEEWGGDTQYIEVSALRGQGIDRLLEAIGLQAELLELRANPNKQASGVVIEARLDRARGPVATVLVQQGTVRVGDIVVAGDYMGKVRALLDDSGASIKEAGPATPVELLGIDGVPDAGETLNATDERTAKQVVEHRREQKRKKEMSASSKLSLESIMEKIQEGNARELKVVLKADVQGSSEALKEALIKLSTPKVSVNVISAGVGGITESDVNLAKAGGAIIVGFHVRPAGKSARLAEREGVDIKLYNVIYEALDEVKAAMAGLLAPIKKQKEVGKLEVRETFAISKVGTVAGCRVVEGKIQRKSLLRVVRDAVQVYEGRVGALKRFKDDVSEVEQGYECGVLIDGLNDIRVGDVIEAYEIVEEAATL